jgi:putative addiction module antidote
MQLQIIQIGNSDGIILPKKLMIEHKLKRGQTINASENDEGVILKTKKKRTSGKEVKYTSSITPEILRVMDRVNKEYSAAFEELAKK